MMKINLSGVYLWSSIILGASFPFASFAGDECQSILEQGIRNTYQSLRNSNLHSSMSKGFCHSQLKQVQDSGGGGLTFGFPVDGIPVKLGGNYSETSANNSRSDLCNNQQGNLSDSQYETLLTRIVDPQVVAAWSSCKASSGGVLLDGELNGSTSILSIRFRNVGPVSSTKLIGPLQVKGASCPEEWITGMNVTGSKRYLQCSRFGDDPITATVNTEFDGAKFYIPPTTKIVFTPQQNPESHPAHQKPKLDPVLFCAQDGNPTNRCAAQQSSAGPVAPNGTPCACQHPWAPSAFNNGKIITEYIAPPPGILPAPGGSILPAPGASGVPIPAPK